MFDFIDWSNPVQVIGLFLILVFLLFAGISAMRSMK